MMHFVLLTLMTGSLMSPKPHAKTSNAPIAASDPIEKLIAKLSSSHGLWQNGLFPTLDLPESASTEQVVARFFQRTSFDQGHASKYRILESRQVQIPGSLSDTYTALLLDTDFGKNILLLRYEGPATGWWSRIYEAGTSD